MNRKRLLIITPIVAVLIAAVAVPTLLLTVFAKPSQDDFKQTQTTLTKLSRDYEAYGDTYQNYVDDYLEDGKADRAKLDSSLATYNETLEKLSKEKALKNESVRKSFDSYERQNSKANTYFTSYVDDLDTYRKVSDGKCTALEFDKSDPKTLVANYDALVKTCQSDIDALKQSKNEVFKLYGKTVDDFFKERRPLYEAVVEASDDPDSIFYKAAIIKLEANEPEDIVKEVSDIQKGISIKQQYDGLKKTVDQQITS